MSNTVVQSRAVRNRAVSSRFDATAPVTMVAISRTVRFVSTGDGTGDLSAPEEIAINYISQTGAVTVNLNSLTDDEGDTINLTGVREITLEVSEKNNAGAEVDDAAVVIVGNAASAPFVGDWSAGTVTVKVQKGSCKVLHIKPYGAPLPTSGANNLKLDFGSYTLNAKLIIKGKTG